jgi:hypothetical protein
MDRKLRLKASIVIGVATAGCQYAYEVDRAKLMPEPVARAILVKYLGQEWVDNPHIYYECDLQLIQKIPININQLTFSRWHRIGLQVGIGGLITQPMIGSYCMQRIVFDSVDTNAKAIEVTQALAALGAAF